MTTPVTTTEQAFWRQFSEATTAEEFCGGWLGLQIGLIDGAAAGVVVLEQAETGSLGPVAVRPAGQVDPQRFTDIVQQTIDARKGVVLRTESEDAVQLGFPVLVADTLRGVVALQIAARAASELQRAMRQLQWGVGWLQNWVLRRAADPRFRENDRLATAVELTARTLEEPRFRGAATAVVTELATRLDCDRVGVGFLVRGKARVLALSHSAQFGKEMNLIRAIGAAMEESIDQRCVTVWPERSDDSKSVAYAHGQLATNHGDRAICTVPFVDHEGEAFGAMTMERSADRPFDAATTELVEAVAALVGPILEEKRRNDRLLVTKAVESGWTQLQRLFGPRHTGRKIAAAVAVLLALFFAFAKGDYRVTAKATLEGEVRRVVAAPFAGFVFDAPVRSGDVVEQGAVLCRLDVRDLQLEYSKWSSQREQYLVERRKALSEGDRSAVNVLAMKVSQADAQLALLDEQIERAEITSPFDGFVVSGDLSQQLGAPVEAGQILFEVAPLDAYRVKLEVDDRRVRDIREGQTGRLLLAAIPGEPLDFEVTKLTPVAVASDGRTFFVVEGALREVTPRLRPGMEGFGKVDVDRRRVLSIWTRDITDWLRLKLWSWAP